MVPGRFSAAGRAGQRRGVAAGAGCAMLGAMTDLTPVEERVAHLIRAVDELSDVVARQQREIDALARRVAMLTEREAEREAEAARSAPVERPPHW